jgi:hypothetical protein
MSIGSLEEFGGGTLDTARQTRSGGAIGTSAATGIQATVRTLYSLEASKKTTATARSLQIITKKIPRMANNMQEICEK